MIYRVFQPQPHALWLLCWSSCENQEPGEHWVMGVSSPSGFWSRGVAGAGVSVVRSFEQNSSPAWPLSPGCVVLYGAGGGGGRWCPLISCTHIELEPEHIPAACPGLVQPPSILMRSNFINSNGARFLCHLFSLTS